MGWVEEALPESIVLPTRSGRSRDRSIDADRAGEILDGLERYQFASFDHVLFSLLWTCGMRIGTVRSLDVGDIHLDEQWTDVVHRPETDTPLKNGDDSTREVNLHGWVVDILRAWIDDRRPSVEDSHGREPLLTVGGGRVSRTAIRRHVYSLTDCGGLDAGCECDVPYQSMCDRSVSPHDIRRSSITAWLDRGHEKSHVSGRCDVQESTIDEHYDVRTETQKRELRRNSFNM